MSHLDLRLLGVTEVRLDGKPVVLGRRSSLALLAYLVVTGGTHPREVLTTLFFGDGTEDQARRRLSNALADLRQTLAPCLLSTWHVVGLRPDLTYSSDVEQFNGLLEQAHAGDDAAALRAAADLYHGEFLAGVSLAGAPDFEMWLLLQRESYHARFVQTLEELASSAVRRAAWRDGAWAAQKLVVLEPWHEEAHRELMRCLAALGQRHLALAQFDTCRRVLRDELDSEPSEETVALYDELKSASVVSNNVPAQTTPCLGRERECTLLAKQVAAADSRLVTVVGPPGIGKSRLALEVAAHFTRSDQPTHGRAFRDGVYIVRAPSEPGALPEEIARTLGIEIDVSRNQSAATRLTEQLNARSMLLVLDGVDGSAATVQVIEQILANAPHVTLLVTAPFPLRVEGEHVLTLGGLVLPSHPDDLEGSAAGALLVTEAKRADIRFKIAPGARPALVQLCHLVHGLPQGLILAARALTRTSATELVGVIEAALTAPASAKGQTGPWWTSPGWALVVDALRALELPDTGGVNGLSGLAPPPARTRRATPLTLLCSPDVNPGGVVDRLRQDSTIVCVGVDLQACVDVATSIRPDVILIDSRVPRRLEQLLRADPACGRASIRWLNEPGVVASLPTREPAAPPAPAARRAVAVA